MVCWETEKYCKETEIECCEWLLKNWELLLRNWFILQVNITEKLTIGALLRNRDSLLRYRWHFWFANFKVKIFCSAEELVLWFTQPSYQAKHSQNNLGNGYHAKDNPFESNNKIRTITCLAKVTLPDWRKQRRKHY